MILRRPTLEECELIRQWRNAPDVQPNLRTKHPISKAHQERFYRHVIAPNWWTRLWWFVLGLPRHEYFALECDGTFVGIGALTFIKKRSAEISVVLGHDFRGQGVGTCAVEMLMRKAKELGIRAVTGECYRTGNTAFWCKQIQRRPALLKWTWTV